MDDASVSASIARSGVANPRRRRALIIVGAVLLLVGVAWGAYWYVHLRWFESTDNAYVAGDVVQITPQIAGTVVSIGADDTDFVRAGQPLVKLDPADAGVALDQAQAELGRKVREVRTLFANNGSFAAAVALREADARRSEADLSKAQDDLRRRSSLATTGAVSGEELEHARTAVEAARSTLVAARAAVTAARDQLSANRALTEGTDVENHPDVQRAAARVKEALLAVSRAELRSPVDGYVAKRTVQLGQRVSAGAPLMSVIPLGQAWVDANFKEGQLARVRIGQPVRLTADVYGGKVEYDGRVVGLGAGTGAAFSLLPAQNATGNWIKVVQRVPVRVALDPKQLAEHPLRVGLSMEATVDVHDQSGKALSDVTRREPVSHAVSAPDDQADALVERIIAANLGRRTQSAPRRGDIASTTGARRTGGPLERAPAARMR